MLRTALLAIGATLVSAQLPGDNGPVDCAAVSCLFDETKCYGPIPEGECCAPEDPNLTYFPNSGDCQDCTVVRCATPVLGPQADGFVYEQTGCCSSAPADCVNEDQTFFDTSVSEPACQDCRVVRCAAPVLVGPQEDGFIYEQTGCCSSEIVGCVEGDLIPASTADNCVAPVSNPTCENPFPFVATVCVPTPQCAAPSLCPEGQLLDASGFCRDAEACQTCATTEGSEWGEYSSCGPVTCDTLNGPLCPGQPIVGCHLEDCPLGQVRDENNRCILVEECPPVAPNCEKVTDTYFPISGVCDDCTTVRCFAPVLVGPQDDGFIYEQTGCCSSVAVGCVEGEFLPGSTEGNCVSPVAYPTCENPFPIVPAVCWPEPQCVAPPACPEGQLIDANGVCQVAEECPPVAPNCEKVTDTYFPISGVCDDCTTVRCFAPVLVGPQDDGFIYEQTGCCSSVAVGCVEGEFLPGSTEGNCVSPVAYPTCENPFPIVPAVCWPEPQCVAPPACPEGQLIDANGVCQVAEECPPAAPVEFQCPNQVISTTECNTADGEARCGEGEDCVEGFCCPQYTPYLCPADNLEGTKCNTVDGEARCGEFEECNDDGFCCLLQPECPEFTVDSGNTWTTCPTGAQCFAPDVTCGATEVPVNRPGQENTGICCQAIISDEEWAQLYGFTAADEAAQDSFLAPYYYNVELVLVDAQVYDIDVSDGSLIRYVVATVLRWIEDLLWPYNTVLVEIEHEFYVSEPSTLSVGSTPESGIKLKLVFSSDEDSTDKVAAQAQKVATLFSGVNSVKVGEVTSFECGAQRACPTNNSNNVPVAAVAAAAVAAALLLGAAAVVVCRRRSAAKAPVETAQPAAAAAVVEQV